MKIISVKRLRKLNPSIKSDKQARKILKDYKNKPKCVLNISIRN